MPLHCGILLFFAVRGTLSVGNKEYSDQKTRPIE